MNSFHNIIPLAVTRRAIARRTRSKKFPVNICMLHSGRCGSTVLASMLNQHSEIHWAGEIFQYKSLGKKNRKNIKKHNGVKTIITHQRDSCTERFFGFETKILPEQHMGAHRINLTLKEYLSLLQELAFSKIIVLKRKNILRQAISAIIGEQRGFWHISLAKKTENITVNETVIDINHIFGQGSYLFGGRPVSLVQYLRHIKEHHKILESIKPTIDRALHLAYEEDIQYDPHMGYRKICEFISANPESPDILLKSVNPYPLSELVVNFDEVKAHLKATEFEWMTDS